jgi:DNA mismatch repair protein MSH5
MVVANGPVGLASADVNSCAAMSGVPEQVVQRAEDLILLSMRGEDLIAACCQMPDEETAELEEAVNTPLRLDDPVLTWPKERIARTFLSADVNNNPKGMLATMLSVPASSYSSL